MNQPSTESLLMNASFVFEPIRIIEDVPCVLCESTIPEMTEAYSLLGSRHICPKCVKASCKISSKPAELSAEVV